MATKVKLRDKKISKGRKSLYLDSYPPIPHPKTGEPTRREFLGLYVFEKTKTPFDKKHNEETKAIAESIRQKRENFLNKPEIYSQYEKEQLRIKEQGEKCFVEYFEELTNATSGATSINVTVRGTGVNPTITALVESNGGWLGYIGLRGADRALGSQATAVKFFFIALLVGMVIVIAIYYKVKLPTLRFEILK